MGNPIFDMLSQASPVSPAQNGAMGGMGGFMNMLNGRFGSIQNAMQVLNGLMGRRGMNPRQTAINELKGKRFSQETINEFRAFARKNGLSDQDIDNSLREIGLL